MSDHLYRVEWVPGADRLHAVCHCAAEREFEDPVELWDWLLGHPVGHGGPGGAELRPSDVRAARPDVVPRPPASEAGYELVVGGKDVVAAGVVRLTLRDPSGGPVPAWTPGAHVDLVLTDDLVRQYSLCGDPADATALTVAVLRERDGRGGSRHVHDELEVGDRVRVRGPRNHFPLEAAPFHLFIAGGIGITPILPMVAAAQAAGTPWRLLYGGRSRRSMAFRDDLQARHPDRVDVRPQDEHGLLDLAAALDGVPAGTAVHCCGPEPLLLAVEAACARRPGLTLHVERFAPKAGAAEGPRTAFDIELAQTGTRLTVSPDASILQTIEDAGIPVLSSCQEGTCGTCETAVVAGEPDHRDSVLTAQERAGGDTMMICVSRSRSALLVLDR